MSEPAKNRRSRQKRMFGRLKNELDAMSAEVERQRGVNASVAQENMDLRAELAAEKARREAAESGFQKVLRFLWECRTIKDLRKELAGFGKSEVEKRADSLARELAAMTKNFLEAK